MSEVAVVFCHIPKCGGISIVKALEENYGPDKVVSLQHHLHDPRALYWTDYSAYWRGIQEFTWTDEPIYETVCRCGNRNGVLPMKMGKPHEIWCSCGHRWMQPWDKMYPVYECKAIWGHFPFRALENAFGHETYHISWMRDPVERLISLYYYWKAQPGGYDPHQDAIKAGKMSLLEFASTPQQRESITRVYFDGVEDPGTSLRWVFDFDQFERSWGDMFRLILERDPPPVKHENAAKLPKLATKEERQQIAAMNPEDMGFWLDYKASMYNDRFDEEDYLDENI